MGLFQLSYLNAVLVLALTSLVGKWLARSAGTAIGWYLRRKTMVRRQAILAQVRLEEEKYQTLARKSDDGDWEKVESHAAGTAVNGGQADDEWEGMIGFFHPFCNAGGGGERVLWAAIRATQQRWPKVVCIVYTGDHDASKAAMLDRVESRFNIHLHPPTIVFLYLQTRHYVIDSAYPRFTLLGQSLGSLVLAHDAFSMLVPDIFLDTMGYAFALALSKFFFPEVPTGAYVHYPTISTDMLGSLDAESTEMGLNAGAGRGWKGKLKRAYWHVFAWMYGWVGGDIDVVMTNSSWTQAHVCSLWTPHRAKRRKPSKIEVVYPPVAVEELEQAIAVDERSEKKRERIVLCIAQFRPEKSHALVIRAFSKMIDLSGDQDSRKSRLVLIGSVRNSEDATKVYDLRLLAHELKIKDQVEFICDASWPEITEWLGKSWVGINGMWNEHFGIGVVEYQAAGLICVVNNSGGPKENIVVEYNGGSTGFHASSELEYAKQLLQALSMSDEETLAMRLRARSSAKRFTEAAFAKRWIGQIESLVGNTLKR